MDVSPPGAVRRAAGLALGLALAALVARYSLAEYLAPNSPHAALWLNGSNATALLETVSAKLDTSSDESEDRRDVKTVQGETAEGSGSAGATLVSDAIVKNAAGISASKRAELRATVLKALQSEPMNAWGLRLLGQLAAADGDQGRARQLMERAVQRSLRESVAALWMLDVSDKQGDAANLTHYADILLRTRGEAAPFATWKLTQQLEKKEVAPAAMQILAANPPWRESFIANSMTYITDARTPLELMLALRASPAPPSARELKSYLDFLIGKKFYELAYYTWLQFLPEAEVANLGLLTNPGFDRVPSGLPFDWILGKGKGAMSTLAKRSDAPAERTLEIEFGQGRVEFPGVSQLILLGAGQYTLRGSYRGKLTGRRGLVWRVTCAATGKKLGESSMIIAAERDWKTFDFSFEVPAAGCRAQTVALELDARSASETMVSGRMSIDGLNLSLQAR